MANNVFSYRTPCVVQRSSGPTPMADFDPPSKRWVKMFMDRISFARMTPAEMQNAEQLHGTSVVRVMARWSKAWADVVADGGTYRIVTAHAIYAVKSVVNVDEQNRHAEILAARTEGAG